jgi:hypothetical protein
VYLSPQSEGGVREQLISEIAVDLPAAISILNPRTWTGSATSRSVPGEQNSSP